jgi:hypothetical protein
VSSESLKVKRLVWGKFLEISGIAPELVLNIAMKNISFLEHFSMALNLSLDGNNVSGKVLWET